LNTPADLLAQRLAVLTLTQRLEVDEAWRSRGIGAVVRREAAGLAARWQRVEELPPAGGQTGWNPGQEMILQVGLDGLLGLCHPDVGHLDEDKLPRWAASELARRYVRSGYWYRSPGLLLLPRRAGSAGLRYPAEGSGPLANTCALLGEDADLLTVVRVAQELEGDDAGSPRLGAEDCTVAPLTAAKTLRLSFEQVDERWRYSAELDEDALDDELLAAVLANADETGAAVLLMPEYCTSQTLRERWVRLLRGSGVGSVRWVVIGSGPTDDPNENIATLISRDGRTIVDQPKTQPFDLPPRQLESWGCPNVPAAAADEPMLERARVHAEWLVVECNRGRLAMAVCESFRPRPGESLEKPLAAARPTLLLCPVFSQPPRERCWERTASEAWGQRDVAVAIANSLVVADWQTDGELTGSVACAASRTLTGEGHSWSVHHIDAEVSGGASAGVVRLARESAPTSSS
jgi:predicted amidohydrolase